MSGLDGSGWRRAVAVAVVVAAAGDMVAGVGWSGVWRGASIYVRFDSNG